MWFARVSESETVSVALGKTGDLPSAAGSLWYALRNASGNQVSRAAQANQSVLSLFDAVNQVIYYTGMTPATKRNVSVPSGSHILGGDYDGDLLYDSAVFFSGYWTFYLGNGSVQYGAWGMAGDIPVAGDFDGDGLTDTAVYRPNAGSMGSSWYIIRSTTGLAAVYDWGLPGDEPVPADFNGDGWTDIAVWRPSSGIWFVRDARSGNFIEMVQWGLSGDNPRLADYNGDGIDDKAVWRPGNGIWYVLDSTGSTRELQWGLAGDVPVPGRYQSSGSVDFAVYRPSDGNLYTLSQQGGIRLSSLTGISSSNLQAVGGVSYTETR
jgi:hypothetical protein